MARRLGTAVTAAWRAQGGAMRRAEIVVVLLLVAAIPAYALLSQPVIPARVAEAAVLPDTYVPDLPPEESQPEDVPEVATGSGGGTYYPVARATGCPGVPAAPRIGNAGYPRIVIPRVKINLEVREGDGGNPPDGQWNAWHMPGTASPGGGGNSFIYAHAHGSPQGSAPGLFWPIHYLHNCDAVYVYTSPTSAYSYQVSKVNLRWPSNNDLPLQPTPDERVTLQTCNTWNGADPKVIIIAQRVNLPPPPPAPSGSANGTNQGSGGPSGPPPSTPPPSPPPPRPRVPGVPC
ncbi:MAG: Sortase domain, partial [Chloroflexota bacterium]|nr:Sortase domain [Chloroflexota bacterium]